MFKKTLISIALATLGLSAFASDYYVVLPVKGKTENLSAIQVALNQSVLPGGQVGAAYSYDFKTNLQVTGDPKYTGFGVSWSVSSGALPAGLSLNATTGVLSGSPTTSGTSNFTLLASYKTKSGGQAFQVVVANITVALASATLADASVGVAYSYNFLPLLAVTGDASYAGTGVSWSVASGALPAGLTLNSDGSLTGTPSAAGASTFTLSAAYKTKQGQQTYSLATAVPFTTMTLNGYQLASRAGVTATYQQSVTACAGTIAGRSDWHLTSQAEFESLRPLFGYAAGFAAQGWPAATQSDYWTTTPYSSGHVTRWPQSSGSWSQDTGLYYSACVRTFPSGALTAATDANFGSVMVGTSGSKTFTFSSGPYALTGVAPTVSGSADLSISSTTCTSTLAANSSCTVDVQYNPTAVGALTGAKVQVASSAENTPAAVTLSGSAVPDTSVVSVLHFDGASGSTTLTDSTATTWTTTGATLNTTTKKFGTASGYFSGSVNAISSQSFSLGSGNFTAEIWFYPTRTAAFEYLFGQLIPNNNSTWSLGLYNGKLGVGAWNAVSWNMNASAVANVNAWNHAALVRSGSTLSVYMNGARVATTSSGVPTFSSNKISLGLSGPTWGDAPFQGYLDEFRLSVGAARYTGATYTVPAAPFAYP